MASNTTVRGGHSGLSAADRTTFVSITNRSGISPFGSAGGFDDPINLCGAQLIGTLPGGLFSDPKDLGLGDSEVHIVPDAE